jgi:hypothetical protein
MNKSAEQEKLMELLNFVFWKKFHSYGNRSIKGS